ncbi:MAG: hypothetical protein LBF86_01575 [Helicobacteraceae bacterium]|jgi:type II secretory pathway component PulK|nr:hypothetical protein [Helicobacteraceae bacterium]
MRRGGFSLITAIMALVIIATIGMAILSLSTMSVEQKTQAFMRAQAELYAGMGMEYAVNELLRRGNTTGAASDSRPDKIDIKVDQFDINVTIRYADGSLTAPHNPEALYMLIDTVVTGEVEGMPIRYARRTVQLP